MISLEESKKPNVDEMNIQQKVAYINDLNSYINEIDNFIILVCKDRMWKNAISCYAIRMFIRKTVQTSITFFGSRWFGTNQHEYKDIRVPNVLLDKLYELSLERKQELEDELKSIII